MTISIRAAKPGDEARLAAIGAATFLESYADVLRGDDILAHCAHHHGPSVYAGWLADSRYAIWLAEAEGGAPIGYIVSCPPDLPLSDIGPRDIEIKRIYVLHRFQMRRVGWSLICAALETARTQGRVRALLGVYARNARAIAFYERVGFRRLGERKFQVGDTSCDDLILGAML